MDRGRFGAPFCFFAGLPNFNLGACLRGAVRAS